jgi:predicted dehydrogenase
MTQGSKGAPSRRDFLKQTGGAAAVAALAGVAVPPVHTGENNTIRLAIVGCGGRGSGAVANALSAPGGPVKLVAMADLFEDRLKGSHAALSAQFGNKIDVPPDRRFLGFDAYRKAIDCLGPGDVALCTTHAAFRPTHVAYAVEKGVNVFIEKNFAPDPGGAHQILKAGEAAEKKNLKIAAGVMCRHSRARQALIQKMRDGAMGQIQLIRAYRMGGGGPMGPFPKGENELLWQIRHAYLFNWASSGLFLELMIHQIDECCWIKDGWPVAAHGVGGRIANSRDCSEQLDSYSIEYTFADGTKAMVTGRYIANCYDEFATFVHGANCAAQFSGDIHAPTVRMYKDQRIDGGSITWKPEREQISPWQAEWNDLLDSIRKDRPHNEARRAAYSTFAAIMGRAAVHSGKVITWDQVTASNFFFCPNVAALTKDSPAPVQADKNGCYAAPVPGAHSEI